MRSRPILFSGAMVRALLDGTKTQTRRSVKFPSWTVWSTVDPGLGAGEYFKLTRADETVHRFRCPYGMAGDFLWVRESFCDTGIPMADPHRGQVTSLGYAATMNPIYRGNFKFKPSIHMPRWASRITLEITDVRVERLQDISAEDAVAEGIERTGPQTFRSYTSGGEIVAPRDGDAARVSYFTLWQSINGVESYQSNPFVWVIEFAVHKRNVDELLRERGTA